MTLTPATVTLVVWRHQHRTTCGTNQHTRVGVDGATGLGPITILYLEGAALLVARRRCRRVVGALRLAAIAVLGGDPEIGRTGVEVDGKVLTGCTDGYYASPLFVLLVVEGFSLTVVEPAREDRELRDVGTRVETIKADIRLEVNQVLAVLAVRRDADMNMGPRKRQWGTLLTSAP